MGVPATETSSERVSSVAGLTVDDQCTQFSESSPSRPNLLLLHFLNNRKCLLVKKPQKIS